MRKYAIYSLLLFVPLLLITSCGKDVDIFIPDEIDIPDPEPIGDISNFFNNVVDINDYTTVTNCQCNAYQHIVLPSGTVFEFNADNYEVPSDIDCSANGGFPLEFRVTELDSKGEIILAGKHTVSDRKLLESRAEYYVELKYDDKSISLKDGRQQRFYVNDNAPQNQMELFSGGEDEFGFTWMQQDGDDNTWDGAMPSEWVLQDSNNVITGFGYECFSDSLNWINVDIFKDVPDDQKTSACVELPEDFTNTNTAVFMVFDDFNGVISLYGDSTLMMFCEPYNLTPIGFNVTFIVISEQGEDCYFFGQSSAVVTENHVEAIIPAKMPLEEIKEILLNL